MFFKIKFISIYTTTARMCTKAGAPFLTGFMVLMK